MAKTQITKDDVRHVAKLAALALSHHEEQRMQEELAVILGHMTELDELDVGDVEPAFYQSSQAELRRDQMIPSLPRTELLMAAPAHEAGGFAVPKVLDGEG